MQKWLIFFKHNCIVNSLTSPDLEKDILLVSNIFKLSETPTESTLICGLMIMFHIGYDLRKINCKFPF